MQYRPDPLGGRTQTTPSLPPSSNERQREMASMRYDSAGPTGAVPLGDNSAVGGQQGQAAGQSMGPPMGMIAMVQHYLDQHGGAQPQAGEQGPISHDPRNGRPQQQNAPQHQAYAQPPYGQHNNGGNMPHSQAGPSNYARPDGYPSQHPQHHPNAAMPQQYNGYSSYSSQGYPSNLPANGQQRFAEQVNPGYTIAYPSDNRSSPYPSLPPNPEQYGRQDSAQPYFAQQAQQQHPHARHPSQAKTSPSSSHYPHDNSRPTSSHMGNRGFQIVSSASSQHHSDPSMSHSVPQSVSPPRPGFDDEGDSARASSARKRKVEGSTDREGSLGGGSKHDSDAKDANGMPTFVACTKCRMRKIKCGGQKPACLSCVKKGLDCCYDAVIKRRGPDKNPGGRVKNRELKDRKDGKSRGRRDGESGSGEDGVRSSEGRAMRFDSSLPPSMHGGSVPPGYPQYAQRPYLGNHGEINGEDWQGMHASSLSKMSWQGDDRQSLQGGAPRFPISHADLPPPGSMHGNLAQHGIMQHDMGHMPSRQPPTLTEPPLTFEEAKRVLENGNRPGNGHGMRSEQWNAVSPTGVNKMGMRDLVSGYHDIMSQAEILSQPTDRAMSNNHGRKQVMPNIWLERLPDIAYSRDSEWMWMTSLFSPNPAEGLQAIHSEVRDFFGLGFMWFSFFHRSLFMARLHHPEERLRLQPSLILAMFSITTLAKSTREGPDGPGRKRALMYAEAGQSMLQQSIISQSMDPTMAQAALILAAFEAYPHGHHASHRFANALQNLDTIIQAFQLLALDVNDERASIFIPGQIPLLANDSDDVLSVRPIKADTSPTDSSSRGQALAKWAPEPAWPLQWSPAEIRQDELRRMCWIASSMAGHLSQFRSMTGQRPIDFYMAKPENYALFFTAEILLVDASPTAGKSTIWALFNRCTLLWHYMNTAKHANQWTPDEKLEMAREIWREADRIEQAINSVDMDGGRSMKWQATDWLLNLRLLATDNFRLLSQMFGQSARTIATSYAKKWLAGQSAAVHLLMSKGEMDVPYIERRSFIVWSLMSQANTALDLYQQDPTLVEALQTANDLTRSIELVAETWPTASLTAYMNRFKGKFALIAQDRVTMLS